MLRTFHWLRLTLRGFCQSCLGWKTGCWMGAAIVRIWDRRKRMAFPGASHYSSSHHHLLVLLGGEHTASAGLSPRIAWVPVSGMHASHCLLRHHHNVAFPAWKQETPCKTTRVNYNCQSSLLRDSLVG